MIQDFNNQINYLQSKIDKLQNDNIKILENMKLEEKKCGEEIKLV